MEQLLERTPTSHLTYGTSPCLTGNASEMKRSRYVKLPEEMSF